MKKKKLRSGYTTGACAAAAAKAAVLLLLSMNKRNTVRASGGSPLHNVEIPFPDGSRVRFQIQKQKIETRGQIVSALASVIKDAGDDPDVTNGAEIVAEARSISADSVGARHAVPLQIKGGKGVGKVTKPGLSVPVGEPAINPVPRTMIKEAVREALHSCRGMACRAHAMEITISVPKGEELAKKTLNHRLGIVGGISILGTTGIVKPISTEAWTMTITSSMDVARAMGRKEVVLCAGRASEKSHMKEYQLPEESYTLMGDHLEYSLREARKKGFEKIHLAAQWAKMVKIAMATPQTHVKFGALDTKKAVAFLNSLGLKVPQEQSFNTAREIFDYICAEDNTGANSLSALHAVCKAAKNYAQEITAGQPVITYLISYEGKVLSRSE